MEPRRARSQRALVSYPPWVQPSYWADVCCRATRVVDPTTSGERHGFTALAYILQGRA